jgi:glutaredoxin-like protein
MSDSVIIVYASDWCGDCRRARRILNEHQVPYEWISIDRDKQAEQTVKTMNRGMRSVPTLVFPDGSILVEPTNAQLEEKLEVFQKS